jgi:uncharacterized membrane protein
MREPTELPQISIYDYSDKSVPHAGYAAIAYGVLSLVTGLMALLQYFIYHRPSQPGLYRDFANQQWLRHTPFDTAITVALSIISAVISFILAFGIFRRSRVTVVLMLAFVILPQLYTWFVARSVAGTLVSIIVAGFLLRGAKSMFQDHAERHPYATKKF